MIEAVEDIDVEVELPASSRNYACVRWSKPLSMKSEGSNNLEEDNQSH